MQSAETAAWKKRIDRPLGVYLVVTYDFLVVGLIPLLTFVLMVRNSDTGLSLPQVMLSVGLYLSVMAFSVWAGAGDNIGRWLVLSAVSLTALMWIVNATYILSNVELSSHERPRVIGYISRAIMSLALNWWYFNRQSTVTYYKRDTAGA